MIKKFFHYLCVVIAGVLWTSALALLLRIIFITLCDIDVLSPHTYVGVRKFWNSGGVLRGKDLLMLLCVVLFFPLCGYGWYKIYHYKFIRLLTVPLKWLSEIGVRNYQAPDINIKNLKVEEKKSIEQIVQERLDQERKKNENNNSATDFRREIIKKLEENKTN